MKIGYIQFAPELNDLQGTLNKLDPLLEEASEADLLVLPELCNSGYNFKTKESAFHSSETTERSEFITFLTEKCQKHHFLIASGFNEREGDKLYNSAILVGREGFIGKYRKLHLFMNEKDFFEPGNWGLPVFDVGLCKIGILICFDWFFPEVWRILALKNVDLICHPSNLVLPGFAQRAIPIHALTNRLFIITANRIGTEDNLSFTGMSTIANPKGEVIAQASPKNEEIKIVEIDLSLAQDKMITPRNHAFSDRIPGAYTLLSQVIEDFSH
ncbi:nitrilase-related carbon-nitrogen hydrolase [Deltaproteobacteria bacterium TL4]